MTDRSCIFDKYMKVKKLCDREYECKGCPIREDVRELIKEALLEIEEERV